jgi:hypothetical protein
VEVEAVSTVLVDEGEMVEMEVIIQVLEERMVEVGVEAVLIMVIPISILVEQPGQLEQ